MVSFYHQPFVVQHAEQEGDGNKHYWNENKNKVSEVGTNQMSTI
jgi:hypothetical protein